MTTIIWTEGMPLWLPAKPHVLLPAGDAAPHQANPDAMRHQIVAAGDSFIRQDRRAVHLRSETPGLGFCALGHLTVVQESAPLFPINERLDQITAIHVGGADVEMVGGVRGEPRGPILEAALDAGRAEVCRRNLRGRVVSASGQQ